VNATSAVINNAGIGRFTKMLCNYLPDVAQDIDFVYYYDYLPIQYFFRFKKIPRILSINRPNVRQIHFPMKGRAVDPIFNFLKINHSIFYGNVDIFFVPDFTYPIIGKETMIYSIHDLCFIKFKEFFSEDILRVLNFYIDRGIKRADHIVTVSESSKRDIIEIFNYPEERISVIYEGYEIGGRGGEVYSDEIGSGGVREGGRYILIVGTIEPRKNHIGLLRAYKVLIDRGYDIGLVIAGRRGWESEKIYEEIKGFEPSGRVKIYLDVSDDILRDLYKNAFIFVYPSFYEGFGIPPLEASSYGLPVICSDVSSMPEVMGDSALYVNPYEPEDIADKMMMVIDDSQLRAELIDKGRENIKRFSWRKSASDLACVFRKVYGKFH